MPKAFEVKSGVAAAAERQLWSLAEPLTSINYYDTPQTTFSAGGQFSVTWMGNTAFASWRFNDEGKVRATINYPFLDDRAVLTRAEADLYAGYTLHELGHIVFTDNTQTGALSPQVFKIWNGLEDPRIEAAMIARGVGGARASFEQLMSKLLIDCKGKWNPCDRQNIPFSLAVLGRARLYGADLPMLRNVYDRMPPAVRNFYMAVMDKLALAPLDRKAGTAYTVKLAQEVMKMLSNVSEMPEEPEQPQQPQQPGQSQQPDDSDEQSDDDGEQSSAYKPMAGDDDESDDSDDGAGGDDEDDDEFDDDFGDDFTGNMGDDGDEGDDSDDTSSGPADEPDDADDAAGDDDGAGDSGGDGADEMTDKPFDSRGAFNGDQNDEFNSPELDMDKLTRKIQSRHNKANGTKVRNGTVPGMPNHTEPSNVIYRDATKVAIPEVKSAAIRQAILRMMDAPEIGGWDGGRASGRFDRKAVSKMFAGGENVFTRRWETEGVDTAAYLLIDCSGSMDKRIAACESLARCIGGIMERARVPFAIVGFTGGYSGNNIWSRISNDKTIDAGRVTGMGRANLSKPAVMLRFKGFDQSMAEREQQINKMRVASLGDTPDLSAVACAVNELMRRPEKRRVMFVLTDGYGDGDQTAARVLEAEALGIDIVGIGIDCDVSGIYPVSVNVEKLEDLNGAAFNMVLKALAKRFGNRRVM